MATQEQIDELIEKMAGERGKLLATIESLTEDQLEAPTDGEWNARQQMSHLCEMEAAYRAWVERAVDEDGANVDGVYGDPPAIPLERANDHGVEDHLAEMRRQREITMQVIGALSPAAYERTAENRMFGRLTVMQWLRSYYRHDRMHIDQLSGQEPTYKPKFTTGAEPDQRRG